MARPRLNAKPGHGGSLAEHVGPELGEAGDVRAGDADGGSVTLAGALTDVARRHRRHRDHSSRGAVRSFASAIAEGDWEAAERAAQHALANGTAEAQRVLFTDLSVVVAGSITQIAAALRRADSRQRWFRATRDTVQLHRVSAVWATADTLSFRAETRGCDIDGYLTLRTVLRDDAPSGALSNGVEIYVHAAVAGSRHRHHVSRALHRALATDLYDIEADRRRALNK